VTDQAKFELGELGLATTKQLLDQDMRRRYTAWKLASGSSQLEIATALQVSPGTTFKDVQHIRKCWQEASTQDLETWLVEEVGHLDLDEKAMRGVMYASIEQGRLRWAVEAHKQVIECQQRRSELLGLNAPKKVDLLAVVQERGEMLGLPPDEVDEVMAEVTAIMKRGGVRLT
jgi:hypothetical protein